MASYLRTCRLLRRDLLLRKKMALISPTTQSSLFHDTSSQMASEEDVNQSSNKLQRKINSAQVISNDASMVFSQDFQFNINAADKKLQTRKENVDENATRNQPENLNLSDAQDLKCGNATAGRSGLIHATGNVNNAQDAQYPRINDHAVQDEAAPGNAHIGGIRNVVNSLDFHFQHDDDYASFMIIDVAQKFGIINYEELCSVSALRTLSENDCFERISYLIRIGISEVHIADTICAYPSLISVDFVKDFDPVIRRLESLDIPKSFIGQAITVEPELTSLFCERALQVRVRALRALNFSRQDCASLLKFLQYKQLGQFLRLPVENIESSFTYLTDTVGLRTKDAIKLLSSFPSILLRGVEEEFKSKMIAMKNIFDDSKQAKKVFVNLPELLGRKTDALEETIMCLKSMVKDMKELRKMVDASPDLLTHTCNGIGRISNYLQDLGFESKRVAALIAQEPYLVSCQTERLQKHVQFLKQKNLDEPAIRSLIENSTSMFFRSLEKRVVQKIEFLENQGISGGSLQKLMKSRPQVYQKSLRNTMEPNLDFLLSLGFKQNSSGMKGALKVTLSHSSKEMQCRIDYLVGHGIEVDDVHKIVREIPSVLVMSISTLKKRVEFLTKDMKYPVRDLVKCPSFLISNIEKTLKPRLRVLEWLRSQGFQKRVALKMIVETTEELFLQQFAEAYPEVSSVYKLCPQKA